MISDGMRSFPVGKLPHEELERVLSRIQLKDDRVVVGPHMGEDAAVIDMGDRYLVSSTDPITFTEKRIGWYCVHVNANDVATAGASPRWFFATLLLPEARASRALIDVIFDDILVSCESLDITLCGGHTEITSGLDRPVLVGQMMGEVEKNRLVRTDTMVVGDHILLTQGAAIEGTSILAVEKEIELEETLTPEVIHHAKTFLTYPGISVVKAARCACDAAVVHGMHDPTEGGIATGLWEMARAGHVGLHIEKDAIPVFPETRDICDLLGLDPLGLIASGALLMAVPPDAVKKVIQALQAVDIPVSDIGMVVEKDSGVFIIQEGKRIPIQPFERDEITRVV